MLLKAITYQCDGFKHFCSTLLGGNYPNWRSCFFKGVGPTDDFLFQLGRFYLNFQGWRFVKNKEYHGKIREKMWGPPLGEYPVAVCSLKIPPYSLYKPYAAGTWWYKVRVLLEGVPTFSIWEDHCCPSPSKLSPPKMRVEFRLTAIVFLITYWQILI